MKMAAVPKTRLYPARHVLRLASVVLAALLAATPVFGQSPVKASSQNQKGTKGAHLGVDVTVTDSTNAVIRKARVVLSSGRDTVAIGASTDARGVSRFHGLSEGAYEIIVQSAGFRTVQRMVMIKKMEHLRVKLEIAVKPDTVEVRAAPAIVDVVVSVTAGPLPYLPYRELDSIRMAII